MYDDGMEVLKKKILEYTYCNFSLPMFFPKSFTVISLQIWGGENVEISLRMWMCGGEMEIVPCSKVGHVYKQKNVYTYPKGNLQVQEPSKIDVTN